MIQSDVVDAVQAHVDGAETVMVPLPPVALNTVEESCKAEQIWS